MQERSDHPNLSLAEWHVLDRLARGVRPIQIAYAEGVGLGTVRMKILSIRLKYGLGTIREVMQFVQKNGVPPKPSDA